MSGFLSAMIFAVFHCVGSSPTFRDVWKRSRIRSFTTGQTSLHTAAGSPSSPAAFHGLAAKTHRSTSSIAMAGMGTGALCGRRPSSSMGAGKGGKKVVKSSVAYSPLSLVTDPSKRTNGGSLSEPAAFPGWRYFAACHMLALSARKSSQCTFRRLRIASWYSFAAPRACPSRLGLAKPALRWLRARFPQYVYTRRS